MPSVNSKTNLGADTNLIGMNGWQVEASPAQAGSAHPSTVRLQLVSTKGSRLTGAGMFALAAVYTTYLTAAKLAAILARAGNAGGIGYTLDREGGWIDILPEDGPTQIPLICAVFQVTANLDR